MPTIALNSPLVPVEWIAAHGLRPRRLIPRGPAVESRAVQGLCPFAAALLDNVLAGTGDDAAVLGGTCDQTRRVASVVQRRAGLPAFLFAMPATWQTPAARELYRDALAALGRFLVRQGGRTPSAEQLAAAMLEYERARQSILDARRRLTARQFALALADPRAAAERLVHGKSPRAGDRAGVPLALVGGPLIEGDYALLDEIESLGGRVALDATEGGERTLPGPFDSRQLDRDPLAALVGAYDAIPDPSRRPNVRFHEWFSGEVSARGIRGVVLRRYVWCDLWHAELARLRERCGAPVLDLDAADAEPPARRRDAGRLEAFLETLR